MYSIFEGNSSFWKFAERFVGSSWQVCNLSFMVKCFHHLVSMLCFIWVLTGPKGEEGEGVRESSLSVLVFKNQIINEMI